MLFKTYIDKNGETKIQKKEDGEYSETSTSIIDPSFFPMLPEKNINELKVISHYVKSTMTEKLKNNSYENIKSEMLLNNIDFKGLFADIFSNTLNIFQKVFYINDENELVNLYDGTAISFNSGSEDITLRYLLGYEPLLKEREEEQNKLHKLFYSFMETNEETFFSDNINVYPKRDVSLAIKTQYLSYIGYFLQTGTYQVDKTKVIKDIVGNIIKENCINSFKNADDFYDHIDLIKNKYSIQLDGDSYVLNNKSLSSLQDISIFTLFENAMSSLFKFETNKESGMLFSSVCEGDLPSGLSEQTKEEIERTLNVLGSINGYFAFHEELCNQDDNYLLTIDKNYIESNEKHQIHKLNYNDFLKYYEVEDSFVHLCIYHFVNEFMKVDAKYQEYTDDVIKNFTKNDSSLYLILNPSEESNRKKKLADIRKELTYPLNVLQALYGNNKDEKIQNLASIAVEIHSDNVNELRDYNFWDDSIFEKLLKGSVAINKDSRFFDLLNNRNLLHDSQNVFALTKALDKHFSKEGGIINKIDFSHAVNNYSDSLFYIDKLSAKPNIVSFPTNSALSIDKVCEKLSLAYMELVKNREGVEQSEIIKSIKWIRENLNIEDWNITTFKKSISVFSEASIMKIEMIRNECDFNTHLLNHHLLHGNNEVALYLKECGMKPIFEYDGDFSSLECAIAGACDYKIIDWICEEMKVSKDTPVRILGFARIKGSMFNYFRSNKKESIPLIEEPSLFMFSQNKNKKNDSDVLNTMAYVYSKYKVDYNFNVSRLYGLINEENKDLIVNKLGIKEIDKIIYGLKVRQLLTCGSLEDFQKEKQSGRLNLLTDLSWHSENNDSSCQSDVLSFIFSYVKYSAREEKDYKERFVYFIKTLLEDMSQEEKIMLLLLKVDDRFNIFEWLMREDVKSYECLITQLAIEFTEFNMKGKGQGDVVFFSEDYLKSYQQLYFPDEKIDLFNKIIANVEKAKIQKNLGNLNQMTFNKKRL